MSDWAGWTLNQQKQFWLQMASAVLPNWGYSQARIDWLRYSSNAVFKIDAGKRQYVLRLHRSRRVNQAWLRSELRWLRHIRQSSTIKAPVPVTPLDSPELFVLHKSRQIPRREIYACLFEYLPGKPKEAQDLRLHDMRAVGGFLGRLHQAAQIDSSDGFERPPLDADGLFGAGSLYESDEKAFKLDDDQRLIFDEVERRARSSMRELEQLPGRSGLIHGDLLAKNILFGADGVAALDFEYCGFGCFLYDLAPLLWQLKGERADEYIALEAALWSGYEAMRPAATRERIHLEDMIAARQLASCRWLLANADHPTVRQQAPQLLAARSDELRDYLMSGSMSRRSRTL